MNCIKNTKKDCEKLLRCKNCKYGIRHKVYNTVLCTYNDRLEVKSINDFCSDGIKGRYEESACDHINEYADGF